MNEHKIIELYTIEKMTLRMIAKEMGTNHHRIKRILVKNGVEITQKGRIRKPFTDEHKAKISKATKGRKVWSEGKKMTKEHVLKNMKSHLKYSVTLDWLSQFEDIEKLKYLNRTISRKRDCDGFTDSIYKKYIEKFYNDDKFTYLFNQWILTGDKWIKPSLDHIHPKADGGTLDLSNLQFISWLENRTKVDIPLVEWNKIKENIRYYL